MSMTARTSSSGATERSAPPLPYAFQCSTEMAPSALRTFFTSVFTASVLLTSATNACALTALRRERLHALREAIGAAPDQRNREAFLAETARPLRSRCLGRSPQR